MYLLIDATTQIVANVFPNAPPPGWSLAGHFVVEATGSPGMKWNGTSAAPVVPVVFSDDVNAERDRRIDAGFPFMGAIIQCDPGSQDNILGASQLAALAIMAGAQAGDYRWHGGETDFVWITADNTLLPLDAPGVVEMGRAAAAWKSACIFAARAIKALEPIPADHADDARWP